MQNSPKNLYKKLLGRGGEVKAEKYLKKLGYRIEHRNLRLKSGEADLVAYDGGALVFIEVKTRTSDSFGQPSESVDFKRQARYIKIAKEYLMIHSLDGIDVRFDIIEVLKGELNHIKNAFCE